MRIEDLTKGSELERDSSSATPTRTWNYVKKGDNLIGIGLYDENSNIAITAIAYDERKKKIIFNELTSDHPTDKGAKENLEMLFNRLFV